MFPPGKMTILGIGLIVMALSVVNCAGKNGKDSQGRNPMATKTIEEVLQEHTKKLMSLPGVVGTGQGLCDDRPCILVFVIKKTPELDQKIPRAIEGYPVRIEETGEIRAIPEK
jgi:hypothetical protein